MEPTSQSFPHGNRTETDYPRGLCIHEIFERQAARTPGALALISGEERWTYARVNERANQFAQRLATIGLSPDSIVALMVERSPEMIAAIIGILKAGAAYAPLDPSDPPGRIASVLEQLQPAAILTERRLAHQLGTHTAPRIEIEDVSPGAVENPQSLRTPRDLAYVMFTSGSTGVPKGVMIEHRSVVRLVQNTNFVHLDNQQVFLQLAPLAFDASTFEIWGALLNGAALAIMPVQLASLADIARAIRQYGVTTMWLTAGLFHAMVDQQLDGLTQVSQLLAGGEVLSPVHVRRFLDAATNSRLINGYGPTEGTTFTCCYTVPQDHPADAPVPIGRPIANTTIHILDENLRAVAVGETGELYAGGDGVARGYLRQPSLTAEKFIEDSFSGKPGARLYRTGDLARYSEDGIVEFLGRADTQVKLRGFRIELGEIETALNHHADILESAVIPCGDTVESQRLVAFVVPSNGRRPTSVELRGRLREKLPAYMIPAQFIVIDALPLTSNGKVDRRALPLPAELEAPGLPSRSDIERIVTEAWEETLGIASPPLDLAFFDLGGSSLQLLRVHGRLESRVRGDLAAADLFRYPTIRSLAAFLAQRGRESGEAPQSTHRPATRTCDIAIIGMAARLPGAKDFREFWQNLKNGVESITHFTEDELEAGGGPNRVRARSIIDGAGLFDASYFDIFPKEAALIDPQHRIFLECSAEALDDAGCDPSRYPGAIGVFAGCSPNSYFLRHLCVDREYVDDYTSNYQVGNYQTMLGASPDFLSTRVSYKLNLTGPSITLGTACSTSLVAVTQACESLRGGQCDMALAGGVSITFPQKRGYQYLEGGIVSPDGHCRAFDAEAQGTVFGSGCAVVLLKPLEAAIADGDSIYAVIKGYGVNNDGAGKVGFTAPGIEGQASAIRRAQQMAGIDPATITYVEAHGTATPLGDPIEIAALTQAFRMETAARQFCAIGSAKTNVGHLDAAAGVTGLIKTALSMRHGLLPPTLHFRKPNPRIDFENSPFYVNGKLSEWMPAGFPRRAGVSAFGVGGTNAHVILEEAPPSEVSASPFSQHVLLMSAKSQASLDEAAIRLREHLKGSPEVPMADVAYTLQTGRRQFELRGMLVCGDAQSAIEQLGDPARFVIQRAAGPLPVAFAFPGQGAQYPGMGLDLYNALPVFRECVDECAAILRPHLGFDLRDTLNDRGLGAAEKLSQTGLAQPAIFTIEYGLARQWMSWGVRPQAMLGHSVGELAAACLAGVFSLSDALTIVAARGAMMQQLPRGAMLSVRAPLAQLQPYLTADLAIASVNSPSLCVIAGPGEAIEALELHLAAQNIVCRKLRTSHAFHSPMVDPIVGPLTERFQNIRLNAPTIPYVSTVTGEWITPEQATSPVYWARHARGTVQFSAAIQRLQKDRPWCILEAGPGQALTVLARQHGSSPNPLTAVASMPDASAQQSEMATLMSAMGRLWLCGVEPDWNEIYKGQQRRRLSLPAYSFERKRYWVDPPKMTARTQPEGKQVVTTPTNTAVRRHHVRSELVALLEDLSGSNLQDITAGTTFLEIGFDSLFLTQVTQSLESKYGVKIRFAQLLDDLSTLEALTAFLDSILPPDPVAVAVAAPAVTTTTTVAAPVELTGSSFERLLKDQLQAFNDLTARQLEIFRTLGNIAAPPAPAAVAQTKRDASQALGPAAAPIPEAPKFESFGPYRPVQKSNAGGLSAPQSQYLNTFTERYTTRTKESKRLAHEQRAKLADPRVASGFRAQWKELVYPITVARSAGANLWDLDGNEYIDLLNGFGVTMFGHCPTFVREAVEKQLGDGIEIGPQTPLAGKVAQLLCELTGNDRATFCNTGSEAVMAAIRVARTVTNKNKIVFFTGAYHGAFDEVLVKAAGKPGGAPRSRPIAPGIPDEKAANILVLEYGAPASLAIIREHAHELAAVLVEPVQSRHPNLQPLEFLRELRTITEQTNTALIFDEVVTGFRAHPGGIQALFDIRADLATYGKVLGGGLPIGVLAGKSRFMDALDGGIWQYGDDSSPEVGVTFFAGTFVRHPLAMAAAWAVLNHIKAAGPQLQEELSAKTGRLVVQLNELFEQASVPSRIESFRSMMYFGFPPAERFASLLYYHLREKGIHIQEGFPCFLTTAHTDAHLDRIVRAFRDSIAEMQQGGFLPAPVRAAGVECEVPLTEAQMEIRLSAQMGNEESCSFNEGFSIHMRGPLNEAALRDSLQTVVDRHEALRSTLTSAGDALRIAPRLEITIPTLGHANEIDRLKEHDASTAFDLINGPLIRAKLVRLAADHHILFITAHHIVCDGWSINIIIEELSQLYTAKCQGKTAELPTPMRFSEYAETQARQSVDAKVEGYWVSEYSDAVSPLELPLDRPRPALKSYNGATYTSQIAAEAYLRIKKAGAQRGSTLFGTLFAGFQGLLSRLTGQSDIVVGVPAAGQSLLPGKVLVGHCVNFLPIRMKLETDPKFSDFMVQSRRKLLEAYDHQSYTYGTLVRKLAIPRNPSRLPLIEVQFNLERVGGQLDFDSLVAEVHQSPKRFVNFDIFLNVVESPAGLSIYCDYNTDLFDESTIARWVSNYETLLLGIVENADRLLSALPLLSAADRNTQLTAWNSTTTEYPKSKCVHQVFEQQTASTPNAFAVAFEGQQLTYAELNLKSNRLAHWLRTRGVGHGTLVGISLEPSLEMLTAVLGVLKSGGAYVPLDPHYPEDRIAFIRKDAALALVLTHENWPALDTDSGSSLPAVHPEDLAYVMYTSGSTGIPKGVEIQHQALMNFIWSMRREPGIASTDKLLAVTTLSFDIAGLELLLPLTAGAELVIAGRGVIGDGNALLTLLNSAGITIMQATPTTWKLLLEAGWTGAPTLKALCGGEELTRDLAIQLVPRAASVWNMYGPTETTIWSTTGRVTADVGPISIGRPIANTSLYILDPKGQPVPVGVPGELHIGGDGLARGYLNRPELTDEKFVRDPFVPHPHARMFRTGDLVRYLPDGQLIYLGRLDHQVKIRGHRIELGEIESALLADPSIRDAAVIMREDQPSDKRLIAYAIPANNNNFDTARLRNSLLKRLPGYMLPALFVTMEALPLTPNGKIDRRALAQLAPPSAVTEDRFVAPRTEEERALASICEQVLGVKRIGIDDDLFALGADSIRLFQIASRAARQGLAITPKQLLQNRTVAAVVAASDRGKGAPRQATASTVVAVSRENFRVKRPN